MAWRRVGALGNSNRCAAAPRRRRGRHRLAAGPLLPLRTNSSRARCCARRSDDALEALALLQSPLSAFGSCCTRTSSSASAPHADASMTINCVAWVLGAGLRRKGRHSRRGLGGVSGQLYRRSATRSPVQKQSFYRSYPATHSTALKCVRGTTRGATRQNRIRPAGDRKAFWIAREVSLPACCCRRPRSGARSGSARLRRCCAARLGAEAAGARRHVHCGRAAGRRAAAG
jgi:hypothetical protein